MYTWGSYSEGTGFSDPSTSALVRQPRKLSEFNGNVTKVSMGRYHSAVITSFSKKIIVKK